MELGGGSRGDGAATPREQRTTYENLEARCPRCNYWNVFNRASDLKTLRPIGGLKMKCQNKVCEQPLWLMNDWINPAFEMLLIEARALWARKCYMQCIMTAVQACEVFMSAAVNTRLLYRPFPNQRDLNLFNELSALLYRRIGRHSFSAMRRVLLRIVLDELSPGSLDEARRIIAAMPDEPPKVGREEIVTKISGRSQRNLLKLFDTKCHEVRNWVVHKYAYRPTRVQAARVLIEVKAIVYGLKHDFGPDLEFEDYANAASEA